MKSLKNLKKDKRVHSIDPDGDGFMVNLNNGWSYEGEQHCFGADTASEINRELARVIPCNCDECSAGTMDWGTA